MRTFDIRITKKSCNSGVTRAPFIGLDIPFVGHNTPHTLPFVGDNIPLVPKRRFQSGFTLTELLITLALLGVISALATPAIRDIVQNNRIATETNDMLTSLVFARSEAIKRSTPVIVCKSLNPSAATPSCDNTDANPWTTGWLVFADTNNNGSFDADELLRIGDGFSGTNNKIKHDGGDLKNSLSFNRLGILASASGGEFYICDSRGNSKARVIEVTSTGRTRIKRDNPSPDCS
jgi:type IV fimbrial biogenesis protein FimT